MSLFPTVFVSHGSPDLLIRESPVRDFLKQLGTQLGKPKAILVVSAHWPTQIPTVSTAAQATTIHDFWGFPKELYQMQYPASGAPKLAERTTKLLTQAGFKAETDSSRGLDHGAWEPLMLMYPQADIPVAQLSIQPQLGTSYHLQLGGALAPLRQEDVLILASGSTTHNLQAFGAYAFDATPPDWVKQFDDWLKASIADKDIGGLLDYRKQAPHAALNHPSDEHLLPLFVALGAGGSLANATQLHTSFTYGVLSMAAYSFN